MEIPISDVYSKSDRAKRFSINALALLIH